MSGTVAIVDGFTNGGSGATITDDGDLSVHEPSTLQDHSQLVVATQPVVLVPSTRMRLLGANNAVGEVTANCEVTCTEPSKQVAFSLSEVPFGCPFRSAAQLLRSYAQRRHASGSGAIIAMLRFSVESS